MRFDTAPPKGSTATLARQRLAQAGSPAAALQPKARGHQHAAIGMSADGRRDNLQHTDLRTAGCIDPQPGPITKESRPVFGSSTAHPASFTAATDENRPPSDAGPAPAMW